VNLTALATGATHENGHRFSRDELDWLGIARWGLTHRHATLTLKQHLSAHRHINQISWPVKRRFATAKRLFGEFALAGCAIANLQAGAVDQKDDALEVAGRQLKVPTFGKISNSKAGVLPAFDVAINHDIPAISS
jgi:hypothetical protein